MDYFNLVEKVAGMQRKLVINELHKLKGRKRYSHCETADSK